MCGVLRVCGGLFRAMQKIGGQQEKPPANFYLHVFHVRGKRLFRPSKCFENSKKGLLGGSQGVGWPLLGRSRTSRGPFSHPDPSLESNLNTYRVARVARVAP